MVAGHGGYDALHPRRLSFVPVYFHRIQTRYTVTWLPQLTLSSSRGSSPTHGHHPDFTGLTVIHGTAQ
jgi:hypothetical protein